MEYPAYRTGEECINDTVLNSDSPDALLRELSENAEDLEAKEKAKVDEYRTGIRDSIRKVVIEDLPSGIGGQFDTSGEVTIATNTLLVGSSVEKTVAQAQETFRHEFYHQTNKHLDPLQRGASAHGEVVVTIGNFEFTDITLHEGLTVADTGNEFVSDDYRRHESDLKAGVAAAGLTMDAVRAAVNKDKDLSSIDDANRGRIEYPVAS